MLTLAHRIYVGKPQRPLPRVLSIRLVKDIHLLADTAAINITAMSSNRGLGEEQRLTPGMPIRISLGYEENLMLEFDGFIKELESQQDTLTIHAVDHMYGYQAEVPARDYPLATSPHSIEKILNDLLTDLGVQSKVVLASQVQSLSYRVFHRPSGPAISVLKRLSEDFFIHIYMRGTALHVISPQQSDEVISTYPVIRYDMNRNVLDSTLTYKHRLAPKGMQIQVSSSNGFETIWHDKTPHAGNTSIKQRHHIKRQQIGSQENLTQIKQHWLAEEDYEGYAGYLKTWLLPPCTYGQWAQLSDDRYPERAGTFFIERVETNFSSKGGNRRVFLSAKREQPQDSINR